MNLEKLNIRNTSGEVINSDFRFNAELQNIPLVVFCHGFKGFKDWGCFPYMLERIAEDGNFAVSFNFSYNGVGENEHDMTEFSRLDKFADNTFTRELEDLEVIIDFLEKNNGNYNYDFSDLTLIGHSRGGGIAILKTAEDKRIKKLITLSTVHTFWRYSEGLLKKWKENGFYEVLNSRTNQMMRQNYVLIEDLEHNRVRLDIEREMDKINVPVLLIHGEQDISVDYSSSDILFNTGEKENKRLKLIPNAGHTFNCVHPFEGTTRQFETVIDMILEFIK
ncbi:alpha/beta fold hydrolase [soil metagenome]